MSSIAGYITKKSRKNKQKNSNVKTSAKYSKFGEIIRYMRLNEYRNFIDNIDSRRHRLMFEIIYELGCRVGEFVRIKLGDIDFSKNMIYIPAENTKTKQARWSFIPQRLINDIKSMLKEQNRMAKRTNKLKNPDEFLFYPYKLRKTPYTENRIRQIFRRYIAHAGLERSYSKDSKDRKLHQFTVHSLRHSHIMHYIHFYKLPLAVVQKQVGHRTLKATSVYLNPSAELVFEAYNKAQAQKPTMLADTYQSSYR